MLPIGTIVIFIIVREFLPIAASEFDGISHANERAQLVGGIHEGRSYVNSVDMIIEALCQIPRWTAETTAACCCQTRQVPKGILVRNCPRHTRQ